MNRDQREIFRGCCRCMAAGIILSAWAVIPAPALHAADTGREPVPMTDGQERLQRIPPRRAVEACKGLNEGDPCSFIAPRGVIEGLCLSGREHIFACRPHRDNQGREQTPLQQQPAAAAPASPPVPTIESVDVPETGKTGQTAGPATSGTLVSPPVQQQPATALSREKAPAPPLVQDAPAVLPEAAPSGSPSPLTAFFHMLERHAESSGSYLAVALLAAGLTWAGFHRYTILPLRRLRMVTQQLAGGDLSARVGEGLVHRRNEVADLGRDVDRMAERTERLVGAHQRLIRDVSHELRSPLARLNVALELARQSAGAAHAAPFDRIERESDRLNELIGQLLMLAKLENDSGSIQRVLLDLSELIAEVAQDADFEARSNERRVLITGSESLLLEGNRELLRQALENLVRNAVRYTAPATAVEICLRRKETGGRSWAHIQVRDQGPGVPESEIFDIFRPFYRVNDSRERQSGGTGVGLAISDRAVRLHGGSLRAFNAPGAGLIMEMELPLG